MPASGFGKPMSAPAPALLHLKNAKITQFDALGFQQGVNDGIEGELDDFLVLS
jgi:hypothetical protein